jgi:hypothetical protein
MLLLRISLIVAILAGVGVIVVSQLKVKPHIEGIIGERNQNANDRDREKARANKAEKELRETKSELDTTKTKLSDTETKLAAETTRANDQERRGNTLQQNLDKTKADLLSTQQALAAWNALGIPVESVRALIESEKKMRAANEALEEEKKILARKMDELQKIVDLYLRGQEIEPQLPAGLRGKVVVVDPKWNFVVLDIGEKQGVKEKGELLVSRESKLLGKVRVMSVMPDRSVANILPGWRMGEVMEGDQVMSKGDITY